MKILFLVGDPPNAALSKWSEICEYQKYHNVAPTRSDYNLVKLLEKDSRFEKMITSARKSAGIPENGISWQEYAKMHFISKTHRSNKSKLPETKGERGKELNLLCKVVKEITFLRGNNLDYFVSNQLPHLMYGNFVCCEPPFISWDYAPHLEDWDDYYYNITIQIKNQVSKNELINYIENNWENISKSMHLPPENKFFISPRDQRIIELRDKKGFTFKQVADKIISTLNLTNSDGKINEDSVKTAYSRAKKKISSLTNNE